MARPTNLHAAGIAFILALGLVLGFGTACNDSGGGGGGGGGDIGDNNPDVYVAMGDSITVGWGVPAGTSYPAQLAGMTGKSIINAGVSGARSSQGAGSVSGILARYKPARLLIMYGANDAIHGASPDTLENNLRAMIGAAKANKTIPIVSTITPMYDSHAAFMPLVDAYNARIRSMAKSEGVALANSAGELGGKRELIQPDGLHPTEVGQRGIAAAFNDRL